jgi:polar amino acid transport system substrate-binding protein
MRTAPIVCGIVSALSLATAFFPAASQAQTTKSDGAAKLVVGTMRIPPFVLHSDDGRWSGLSIDLWKQIAAEMRAETEFRAFDYDVDGLLEAVERKEVDVALAAIPMTPDEESRFDFSHPYYKAGLAIAVRTEASSGSFGVLAGFFTPQVLGTIGGLIAVLILAGTLMWLLERRRNANFDPHPVRGIGDGVWWAAVTMTTTGYGDKVPASWGGRVLGIVWMFPSIFLIALFSATLASSFVVDRLKTKIGGPDDLPRARIAVVSGSAGERWLQAEGLRGRRYPFVIQATKALQRGDVDALIYERAILGHMTKHYGWKELEILPHTLAVHDYAIAIPTGSPITESVNRAVLKVLSRDD